MSRLVESSRLLLILGDKQTTAVKLRNNSLLATNVLVMVGLGNALGAELQVGGQSTGLLTPSQSLYDIDGFLLERSVETSRKVADGVGRADDLVRNATAQELGESLGILVKQC